MPTDHADVVILGGGPTGSTAGTLLKKANPGKRIVILERSRFPRHKVGESTLPDANPVLRKMGVLPKIDRAGFVPKGGITYKWRHDRPIFSESFFEGVNDALEAQPPADHIPDYSWQVDRSRYDAILLDHARECGVEIREQTAATGLFHDGDRVAGLTVAGPGSEALRLDAEFVIDASGQARALGRWLCLDRVGQDLGDLAIYRYYENFRWMKEIIGTQQVSRIFFSTSPAGWMWFIPLSATLVSVGLVTRLEFVRGREYEHVFDEQLRLVEEMHESLRGARMTVAPGGEGAPRTYTVQDWSYIHSHCAGQGWYLAGDAAAFVDPILSSGLLLAHRGGLNVANAVHTEWHCPEIRKAELHESYSRFYGDLCQGFIAMAQWWYRQRATGNIEDWWKRAATASRAARGSAGLDDMGAFIQLIGGFLTDFRFTNIGPGFGDEGFAVCVRGITGDAAAAQAINDPLADRSLRYVPRFETSSVVWYLATHVDTYRWWRLPAIRFSRDGEAVLYRPPMPSDQKGTPVSEVQLKIVEALLTTFDGRRQVEEIVRETRRRTQLDDQAYVHRHAHMILSDLIRMNLVAPAP